MPVKELIAKRIIKAERDAKAAKAERDAAKAALEMLVKSKAAGMIFFILIIIIP